MKTLRRAWRLFWDRTDWLLMLPSVGLSGLGIVLMMGLYQSQHIGILRLTRSNIVNQGAALALGIVLALILANINYRALVDKWALYVPAAYLVFLATFLWGVAPPGRPDAIRWLIVPIPGTTGVSIQPSEFLKLAFIITFAFHAYKTQERFNRPLNIILMLIHAAVPVVLVQLQGDSGTALMFAVIFLSMMFVAGIKWYYMAGAVATVPAVAYILWEFVLSEMQQNRVLGLLGQAPADGSADPTFQPRLAAAAIAGGGMTGNGIFNPSPAYVPEMHNDFIFAFIADSLGFLGCAAVIAVITALGARILFVCGAAGEKQGQVICAGVFAMIFGQSALNICMVMSLLPVIGNSLPFISSGGSFVLANFLGIGLVMSVHKHTKKRVKTESFLPG
jgi:rod shape determining protein RodA